MKLIALIATIPSRKASCERLLRELTKQSRVPDAVVLVLDGYGETAGPECPLPIEGLHKTMSPQGPGNRWSATNQLPSDTLVICLDDDVTLVEAPHYVRALEAGAREHGAAASMGTSPDGKFAPPGLYSRGFLIHGSGCGLTTFAGNLRGLQELNEKVQAAGGPNTLGMYGDDDALVSAHLWVQAKKPPLYHAPTGNMFPAAGTQQTSQTRTRLARKEDMDAQKVAISKVTGWPWPRRFRRG